MYTVLIGTRTISRNSTAHIHCDPPRLERPRYSSTGFDEIRIARVGKDGKLVLKDKTGEVLKTAFGDSTYRWDGKTPLTNMLQKHSFANRGFTGGQTDTGSKTTHRNITVTGAGDWQPVAQGAARGPNRASPAGKMTGLQKQLAALQNQMDQLASPPKVFDWCSLNA